MLENNYIFVEIVKLPNFGEVCKFKSICPNCKNDNFWLSTGLIPDTITCEKCTNKINLTYPNTK